MKNININMFLRNPYTIFVVTGAIKYRTAYLFTRGMKKSSLPPRVAKQPLEKSKGAAMLAKAVKSNSDLEKKSSSTLLLEQKTKAVAPRGNFYDPKPTSKSIHPYQVVPSESKVMSQGLKKDILTYWEKYKGITKTLWFGSQESRNETGVIPQTCEVSSPRVARRRSMVIREDLFPSYPKSLLDVHMDPGLYFKGSLVQAMLECKAQGLPFASSILCMVFIHGIPGHTIQLLSSFATIKELNRPMNMIPYLKENVRNTLTNDLLESFRTVKLQNLGNFYEAITSVPLNESFKKAPFTLLDGLKQQHREAIKGVAKAKRDSLLEYAQKAAQAYDISNHTGQSNPDFVRVVQTGEKLVLECYDQKSSFMSLQRLNHVRPVTGNLAMVLKEGITESKQNIKSWRQNNPHIADERFKLVLDKFEVISNKFAADGDLTNFRLLYNAIRSEHADFFIEYNISMNLFVQVGIDDFILDPRHIDLFTKIFFEIYNSSAPSLISFYNSYIEKYKETFNSTLFLKKFVEHLIASGDI